MKTLLALYHQQCQEGRLKQDVAQEAVLPFFDRLHEALFKVKRSPPWLSWIGFSPSAPQGLYLWGDVGRGKTFLMDFFVASLGDISYRRQHFHAFMQEVHQRLFALENTFPVGNTLTLLGKELRQSADVLCLDEFFVDHIGDAMLLSRLFTALFQEGMVLVTTSNTPPEKLYWKGLQRELVLPFIELLLKKVEVVHLQGKRDHRQDFLSYGATYLNPLGPETEKKLQDMWDRLTDKAIFQPMTLQVKGHRLDLQRTGKGVCWTSFQELCGSPLGAGDYLKLMQTFSVLILSDIPELGRDQFNDVRRFIILVDLLYENRFQTVFSAAVPLSQLYLRGKGAEDFRRTRSRLEEMQSWDL